MTQDKGAVTSLLSFGAANWMSNSATVPSQYILKGVWNERRMCLCTGEKSGRFFLP